MKLPTNQLRRSVLYVPASNERAMNKASQTGADCLIIDLEDAVAPEAKEDARARAVDFIRAGVFGETDVVVRINAQDSPWSSRDLEAVAAVAPHAVLLPKVNSGADVMAVCKSLDSAGAPASVRLWAMVETPVALLGVQSIASAASLPRSRLECLVMGLNDLAKETSVRLVSGRQPMLHWLSATVLAARAQGLSVIDGVFNALNDATGLREECRQARDFGFDGKTLIHPNQVAIANRAFMPDDEEISHARSVVLAFSEPGNTKIGALQVDGRMVERLHLQWAERILAQASQLNHEQT